MIHVSFDDVSAAISAAMLPSARPPFQPYRNIFLTWARPRLLYSPVGPSRIGQPVAAEGSDSEGGCYIHPRPLAEEEVPEPEEM